MNTVASITVARDEMSAMFKAAVDAYNATSPAQQLIAIYDDVQESVPDSSPAQPWVRLGVKHANGVQASLAGVTGLRRYNYVGIVMMELYCPTSNGQVLLDLISPLLLNAFQGQQSPSGIWFRNGVIKELGNDGAWSRDNIVVDFDYDLFH